MTSQSADLQEKEIAGHKPEYTKQPKLEASMVALSPNHADLEAPRKEFLFSAPAALLPAWRKLMRDERDEPMLHLMWNILTTTVFITIGDVSVPSVD